MSAIARLSSRLRRRRTARSLVPPKVELVDLACRRTGARSLADLGGVWAVDAGYALHALDRHGLDRVVVVDDDFTPGVEGRAARDPDRIELVRGNLGRPEQAERVGRVDLVLLFDVLLHQVDPDWDEVLELYANRTGAFALAGPWWDHTAATVRLPDLGREEYLASVPDQEEHRMLHGRLDEVNERRGRAWRNVHDVWQWGIADADLRAAMDRLGFDLAHFERHGRWRGLERFFDGAYLFVRRPDAGR